MTLVSVLIPTHDHASTLGLAVESALRQTVRDIEVLICQLQSVSPVVFVGRFGRGMPRAGGFCRIAANR